MKFKECCLLLMVCAGTTLASAGDLERMGTRIKDVRLRGYLGQRLDSCISNNVIATDGSYLAKVFLKHEGTSDWQSEFWGKWMHSSVPAFRYTAHPGLRKNIDDSVRLIRSAQREDGYIGNYRDDRHLQGWDIWGRKYTMLGLLQHYDLTGDKASLRSACRVADQLMSEVGPGAPGRLHKIGMHHGMASCSVLEPIVQIYTRTHEPKYLEFAKHVAAAMEDFEDSPKLVSRAAVPVAERFPRPDPWWSWQNGIKAYEMMSCYQGLLELYQVSGRKEWLEAAQLTAQSIIRDEINAAGSGSAFECWYHGKQMEPFPALHMMETCVTTTWMRLCQTLLRLTGEAVYADELERTAYNAYMASLAHDGSTFTKYCPLNGTRAHGEDQCGMKINCCIANGPRGFVAILESILMADKDSVMVNFYNASQSSIRLPGRDLVVLVSQETAYPKDGSVRLSISPEREADFALKLRIPSWSRKTTVSVNGQTVANAIAGEYLSVQRRWKRGDVVAIHLDLAFRVESREHHIAFLRGPILLARDARFADGPVDESIRTPPAQFTMADADKPVPGVWMEFTANLEAGVSFEGGVSRPRTVRFCDFGSAGDTWSGDSRYRVWFERPFNAMAGK